MMNEAVQKKQHKQVGRTRSRDTHKITLKEVCTRAKKLSKRSGNSGRGCCYWGF